MILYKEQKLTNNEQFKKFFRESRFFSKFENEMKKHFMAGNYGKVLLQNLIRLSINFRILIVQGGVLPATAREQD